ncbi:MAG: hypothetical protein FJ253_09115 [Phycisphaerae bacterium]|nr:hypothetical protein [Phycisphaerae bacterium]
MTRFRLASLALTAALVPAAAALALDGTGTGTGSGTPTPPPTRPGGGAAGKDGAGKDGGGLSGPRVPDRARDGDREFRGGGGAGKGGMAGPAPNEDRLFMQALEQIKGSLSPDQVTRLESIKENHKKDVERWQTRNGENLRTLQTQIQEARKSGAKPDPALIEQVSQLNSSRPKFEAVRKQVNQLLTTEQLAAHRDAMKALMAEKPGERPARRDGERRRAAEDGEGKGTPPGSGSGSGSPIGDKAPPARGKKAPPPAGDKPAPPPSDKPATPPAN